jgi:thiol-disulfide isomerase/thioredoxin
MGERIPSKRSIIILAVVLSLIMYFAGVFSGLFANKVVEEKVEDDVDFLKSYVDVSSVDLKNNFLLQLFLDNIDDDCKFSNLYLNNLREQFEPYWDKLPSRLEAYEKDRQKFTDEYLSLKREYIRLSLRFWLIAMNNYQQCNSTEFVPILYFYSNECEDCVKQGENFDLLKENEKNHTIVVFPIDVDFEDDSVYLLKQYYNITSVPTTIVREDVYKGKLVSPEELAGSIN